MVTNLLETEEAVIKKARQLLEDKDILHLSAHPPYLELLNAYEKLKFLISNFFKSDKKISFKELVNTLPIEENNEITRDFWKTLITHCIVDGILIRDINDIGSLRITDYGNQYLNKQDKFEVSRDNDFNIENKPKHVSIKTGVIDNNLMDKLIMLRKDIAKKNSLPPMQFFKNFL